MLYSNIVIVITGKNAYTDASTELRRVLSLYPNILKHSCHLDVYKPWTEEAYFTVAEQWLQDQTDMVTCRCVLSLVESGYLSLFSDRFYCVIRHSYYCYCSRSPGMSNTVLND